MTERVIIAGSGGQGIMLLGKVLAQAAMMEDKFVTWLPAYGAEVRGGTAHCMVVVSDEEIGSPYVEKADTLIIMNQPSLARFRNRLENKGILIVNSSIVKVGTEALRFPFTEIAIELGNVKVANMVALGFYLAKERIVSKKNILKVMKMMTPAGRDDILKINQKALETGVGLKNG